MHTHFGSATFGTSVFVKVLIFGSVWKLFWLHALSWGRKNGNKHAEGFARAALFQYGG